MCILVSHHLQRNTFQVDVTNILRKNETTFKADDGEHVV